MSSMDVNRSQLGLRYIRRSNLRSILPTSSSHSVTKTWRRDTAQAQIFSAVNASAWLHSATSSKYAQSSGWDGWGTSPAYPTYPPFVYTTKSDKRSDNSPIDTQNRGHYTRVKSRFMAAYC